MRDGRREREMHVMGKSDPCCISAGLRKLPAPCWCREAQQFPHSEFRQSDFWGRHGQGSDWLPLELQIDSFVSFPGTPPNHWITPKSTRKACLSLCLPLLLLDFVGVLPLQLATWMKRAVL